MINDEYILNLFFVGKNKIFTRTPEKKLTNDVKQYLDHRFKDKSNSYKEIIFRIKYNIENLPICPTCGKQIHLDRHNHYRDHCSQYCSYHDTNVKHKIEQTNILNHGTSHYVNKEKRFKTNLEKYGYMYPPCADNVKQKTYITKLNKYGDGYYNNQQKSEETCLKKYGVKTPLNLQEIHYKAKQTNLIKYGVEKPLQYIEFKEKFKNTCLQHYGVDHHMKNKEIKSKFDWDKIITKMNISKHKNNSFHISKKEQLSYDILKEKYPDIITQYKSDLYPYYCDFYIPSLDLYIECNYHWTHGWHPYNENNNEDKLILEKWKSKNTKFYNNAIITWTIRDVNKRNIAKENNLNYIEFWNINELKTYLDK